MAKREKIYTNNNPSHHVVLSHCVSLSLLGTSIQLVNYSHYPSFCCSQLVQDLLTTITGFITTVCSEATTSATKMLRGLRQLHVKLKRTPPLCQCYRGHLQDFCQLAPRALCFLLQHLYQQIMISLTRVDIINGEFCMFSTAIGMFAFNLDVGSCLILMYEFRLLL